MNRIHTVRVKGPAEGLDTIVLEATNVPPWKITVSGLGLVNHVFEGEDLFEALTTLRTELEKKGYQVICAGARIDAYPSGMSRNMGGSRKIYITEFAKSATDVMDIFDDTSTELVGTVAQQKEFHSKWIRSLTKVK